LWNFRTQELSFLGKQKIYAYFTAGNESSREQKFYSREGVFGYLARVNRNFFTKIIRQALSSRMMRSAVAGSTVPVFSLFCPATIDKLIFLVGRANLEWIAF